MKGCLHSKLIIEQLRAADKRLGSRVNAVGLLLQLVRLLQRLVGDLRADHKYLPLRVAKVQCLNSRECRS